MRTIRLHDPVQQRPGARRLDWGSSEWAAESCLADWSTLERQWLEPPARAASTPPAWVRMLAEQALNALQTLVLVGGAGLATWVLLRLLASF